MPTTPFHAIEIAKYFLGTVDRKSGDNITHLKLQKLLYYAQGFHLAIHEGDALFSESIIAWKHGPVVKSIWHRYREYSWQAIHPPKDFEIENYPPEVRELLETVNVLYGQYTAKGLENMTHREPPWKDTPLNELITPESLRIFFSTLVEAGREDRSVEGEPIWPTHSLLFQQRRSLSDRMERNRGRLRDVARRFQQVSTTDSE